MAVWVRCSVLDKPGSVLDKPGSFFVDKADISALGMKHSERMTSLGIWGIVIRL
jgi:hypothetical protein